MIYPASLDGDGFRFKEASESLLIRAESLVTKVNEKDENPVPEGSENMKGALKSPVQISEEQL